MRARLPATMKAPPVVAGFGQIAAQMKKSPSVASAGLAVARAESSTKASTASALGNRALEMRTGVAASRARGFPTDVSERDRSGSPDRAPGRAHVVHGDRHVKGALAEIDRRDGEIRRRSSSARQIDDRPAISLAIL